MNSSSSAVPGRPGVGTRYGQLDALRGLAALTVVFGHILNVIPVLDQARGGAYEPAARLIRLYKYTPAFGLTAAHEAVILFFLLSGFVLALPVIRRGSTPYRPFLIKRVFRIYLPYLVAILISIAAKSAFSTGGNPALSTWFNSVWTGPTTADAVAQHLLLLGSFDNDRFNPAIWSLVHEMRISLIFPWVAWALLPRSLAFNLGAAAALSTLGLTLDHAAGGRTDVFVTLHYLAVFVLGLLIARHQDDLRRIFGRLSRRRKALLLGAGVVLYLYGRALKLALPDWDVQDWPIAVGASMIVGYSLCSARLAALLAAPTFRFLGQISYSLYLLHGAALFTVVSLFYGHWPLAVVFGVALAAALVVSILFHYTVEQPTMRWGQQLAGHSVPHRAVRLAAHPVTRAARTDKR